MENEELKLPSFSQEPVQPVAAGCQSQGVGRMGEWEGVVSQPGWSEPGRSQLCRKAPSLAGSMVTSHPQGQARDRGDWPGTG